MFRKKLSSKPSQLLSDDYNKLLFSLLQKNCVSLTTTIANVYESQKWSGEWKFVDTLAVCFELDTAAKTYHLRFYDLKKKKRCDLNVPVAATGVMLHFESEHFGWLRYYERDFAGMEFVASLVGKKEMRELEMALYGLKRDRKKLKKEAANRAKEEKKYAKKSQHTKSEQDDKVSATLKNLRKSTGRKGSKSDSKSETKRKMKDDKGAKPKITPADIGMPTDLRLIQHIGLDKNGEFQQVDLANEPEMRYLFSQMGIRYEEVLRKENTRKRLNQLFTDHGGYAKFKAKLTDHGVTKKALDNSDLGPTVMTSTPIKSPAGSGKPTDSPGGLEFSPLVTSTPIQPQASSKPAPPDFSPITPRAGLTRIPPPPRRNMMTDIREFVPKNVDEGELTSLLMDAPKAAGGKPDEASATGKSLQRANGGEVNAFLANLESSLFEIHHMIDETDDGDGSSYSSPDSYSDSGSEVEQSRNDKSDKV